MNKPQKIDWPLETSKSKVGLNSGSSQPSKKLTAFKKDRVAKSGRRGRGRVCGRWLPPCRLAGTHFCLKCTYRTIPLSVSRVERASSCPCCRVGGKPDNAAPQVGPSATLPPPPRRRACCPVATARRRNATEPGKPGRRRTPLPLLKKQMNAIYLLTETPVANSVNLFFPTTSKRFQRLYYGVGLSSCLWNHNILRSGRPLKGSSYLKSQLFKKRSSLKKAAVWAAVKKRKFWRIAFKKSGFYLKSALKKKAVL